MAESFSQGVYGASGTTVTSTNTYNSTAIHIKRHQDVSFVVAATETVATLGGTLKVQVSNSTRSAVDGGTATWVQYTDLTAIGSGVSVSTGTITVSGTQTFAIELADLSFQWVRLQWVNATGTGTLVADLTAKSED